MKEKTLRPEERTGSRSAAQRAATHKHSAHPAASMAQSTGAPFEEEPAQMRRIAQLRAVANEAGVGAIPRNDA